MTKKNETQAITIHDANTSIDLAASAAAMEGAELAEAGFILDAPMVELPDGGRVCAYFMGWSSPVETTDQVTGETKEIPVALFRHKTRGEFRLLGAAQLVRKLEAIAERFIAGQGRFPLVVVIRQGEEKTKKGFRVHSFAVHVHESEGLPVPKTATE